MNNQIKPFKGYRKSLITLLVIPVIIISCIYINFGDTIDIHLERNKTITKIYQLKTHYDIFEKDSTVPPLKPIPLIVNKLGYYSIILIYILFCGWLIIHSILTYMNLFFKRGSKFMMLLETFLILGIFVLVIIPGLNIWLSILGYLMVVSLLTIILMYWYAIKFKE